MTQVTIRTLTRRGKLSVIREIPTGIFSIIYWSYIIQIMYLRLYYILYSQGKIELKYSYFVFFGFVTFALLCLDML